MKTKEMIFTSFYIVLMTISATLSFPLFFIPITMQTIVVRLIGYNSSMKISFMTMFFYLVIGLIGFPVFSSGGGLSYVLMPSFGYLLGFIITAPLISIMLDKYKNRQFTSMFIIGCLSSFTLLVPGTIYMSIILNIPITKAFQIGFIPFIIPDLIKVIITIPLANRLYPYMKKLSKT